jgi:hypothetical protein
MGKSRRNARKKYLDLRYRMSGLTGSMNVLIERRLAMTSNQDGGSTDGDYRCGGCGHAIGMTRYPGETCENCGALLVPEDDDDLLVTDGGRSVGGSDRDESGRVLAEETWTHSGLRCRVVKLGMGHYCGYVRSMFDDRWTCEDFHGWPHSLIEVHGGLTYGVDEDGWLGFDCAHAYDRCVDENGETWGRISHFGDPEKDTVWTLDDVKEETEKLAEQVDVLQDFVEKAERYLHTNTDRVGSALEADPDDPVTNGGRDVGDADRLELEYTFGEDNEWSGDLLEVITHFVESEHGLLPPKCPKIAVVVEIVQEDVR